MAKYKKLSVHTESCRIVNAASFHLFVPMIKHSKNYEQFYFQLQATSLKKHMETIHDRRRDFSCVYCNKSFAQSYTLKEHIVAKHTHNFCHTWYQYWQKLYLLHTAAPLNKS